MMNDRTFGVEIEIGNRDQCTMADVLRAAGFVVYCNDDVSLNTPNGMLYDLPAKKSPFFKNAWKVVYDGSVRSGCEVVSPILKGQDGLNQIKGVIKAMNKNGARADYRCGLHVHVGATDLSLLELQNVARRYYAFEPVLDTFVSKSRRASKNGYCRSLRDLINAINCSAIDGTSDLERMIADRYYKVNLLAFVKHGTVEFRQLEGTTSWTKVCNWVEFCVNFVEASRLNSTAHEEYMNSVAAIADNWPADFARLYQWNGTEMSMTTLVEYVYGWDGRYQTKARVLERMTEINTMFPGTFTAMDPWGDYFLVKIPAEFANRIKHPEVTGTWNLGIPDSVVAHLHGLAAFHNNNTAAHVSS
jgi:hypothetical protein